MFASTKTDLLPDVARAYSDSTLNNSCEFSAIVASFLLQKHFIAGIHQYYVLQTVLIGELYIFGIYSSGYLIFEKLGQEKHDIFVPIMLRYYSENASKKIAAFLSEPLSESESKIMNETIETIKLAGDNFMERYNATIRTLRIKSNDYRDISSALFTDIFMDSFLTSNGYATLVTLDEEKREELSTVRDMINSFGREFQKDLIEKISVLSTEKPLSH